jgi:hypothetical protein
LSKNTSNSRVISVHDN